MLNILIILETLKMFYFFENFFKCTNLSAAASFIPISSTVVSSAIAVAVARTTLVEVIAVSGGNISLIFFEKQK